MDHTEQQLPSGVENKTDTERAEYLVSLGWPAVIPYLSSMVWWCMDRNYMVAQIFSPFLVSLGEKSVPYVKSQIKEWMEQGNYYEIYDLLVDIVSRYSLKEKSMFTDELTNISKTKNKYAIDSECIDLAKSLLEEIIDN